MRLFAPIRPDFFLLVLQALALSSQSMESCGYRQSTLLTAQRRANSCTFLALLGDLRFAARGPEGFYESIRLELRARWSSAATSAPPPRRPLDRAPPGSGPCGLRRMPCVADRALGGALHDTQEATPGPPENHTDVQMDEVVLFATFKLRSAAFMTGSSRFSLVAQGVYSSQRLLQRRPRFLIAM